MSVSSTSDGGLIFGPFSKYFDKGWGGSGSKLTGGAGQLANLASMQDEKDKPKDVDKLGKDEPLPGSGDPGDRVTIGLPDGPVPF